LPESFRALRATRAGAPAPHKQEENA
jgi:hypothetical protein